MNEDTICICRLDDAHCDRCDTGADCMCDECQMYSLFLCRCSCPACDPDDDVQVDPSMMCRPFEDMLI